MTRREFVQIAAAFAGAALLGYVGGATAREDGMWGDDDEPPSERNER